MKRKKVVRRTGKKKRKATPKTRARAKRAKKKPSKAKPRRQTQPASKAVLSGGIYAGDPTGGHIGDKPPTQ
jgi:hypothetical protein